MSTNSLKLGLGAAALLAAGGTASADPVGVEAGAFAGAQYLTPDVGVGSSTNAVERPHSAPLFGGRISVFPATYLAGDERGHLDIGLEAEAGLVTAFTGHTNRGVWFSPLIDYRADVLLRLSIGRVKPHLAIGGGAATFASTGPMLDTNTVGVVFWGVGSTFEVSHDFDLRIDLRQDLMPRQSSGVASSFEAIIGLSVPLTGREHHHEVVEEAPPPPPPPPVVEKKPETTPPTSHNLPPVTFSEGPAKPPPLPPDPNLDTDKDGFPDVKDKCPLDPETVNGFQDDDGCPDQIPQALTVTGPALKFAAGRAKLDAADETSLKNVIDVMVANATLKIVVIGHPEAKGKKGEELAQRRAESVRWYLIEHGVADVSRVSSKVGDPVAKKGDAVIDLDIAK